VPPAVVAVCDSASVVVREALGLAVRREDGSFHDTHHGIPRVGCRVTADASVETPGHSHDPVGDLEKSFARRGWHFDLRYSADGPDGSSIGMRWRDMLCLVGGHWDGGDDAEPDTASTPKAPDPAYQVIVECARHVSSNADADVPDSLWSIASKAGLDSMYAISMRFRSPPYESGDFDGDGVLDAAVLIEHRVTGKVGVAIVRRGARQVTILGAGAPSTGPDALDWIDEIGVFHRGTTVDMTIRDRPIIPLIGDALWLSSRDSVSAFFVWTGQRFVYEAHRLSAPPR
jgi:hypothetical protein